MRRTAALAVAAVWLLGSAPAPAATYTQYACAGPDGAPAPADGFVATGPGTADDCARGGGLTLAVGGSARQAGWRYAPPRGTTVAGLVLRRQVRIPAASPAGYALAGSADRCDARSGCGDDVFDLPVPVSGLAFGLACPAGPCGPAGGATVVLRALRIVLRDDVPPAGTLLVEATGRTTVAASDDGGGVRRITLLLDGRVRARRSFCRPPFVRAVPCPPHVRAALDPGGLPPGDHTVLAVVQDATGDNATTLGPATLSAGPAPVARPAAPPRLTGPRRRLRNGDVLVLRARVPGRGRVAFQVRVGADWRTFAVRVAGPGGRATLRHRLRHTVRGVRYAFRVVAVPGGASRPIGVTAAP